MLSLRPVAAEVSVLLVVLMLLAGCSVAQLPPKFKAAGMGDRGSIILQRTDSWYAGVANRIKILPEYIPSTLVVDVERCQNPSRVLHYVCASGLPRSTINLTPGLRSQRFCTDDIVLSVKAKNATHFELVLDENSVLPQNVFLTKVELKVIVTCGDFQLESNSLFVMTLNSLVENNKLIASTVVDWLSAMSVNYNKTFDSVQMFTEGDAGLLKAIAAAPAVFKPKISTGMLAAFGSSSCVSIGSGRPMYFAYEPFATESHLQAIMHLDMVTGVMHYSTIALGNMIDEFYVKVSDEADIALCSFFQLRAVNELYSHSKTFRTVKKKNLKFEKPVYPINKIYRNPLALDSEDVKIFSDSDETILQCPILCSDTTDTFEFDHNGSAIRPKSSEKWLAAGGVMINENGRLIKFPQELTESHAGVYKCFATNRPSIQYAFNVQVVILPRFAKRLPPKIFALEGGKLEYGCQVLFSGLQQVTLNSEFYVLAGNKWEVKTAANDFNNFVAPSRGATVFVERRSSVPDSSLTLDFSATVPRILATSATNFTHRLICTSLLRSSEASEVGMPSYKASNMSDVYAVPRPNNSSFQLNSTCLDKQQQLHECNLGEEASFDVTLSPEMFAYLRSIGVQVAASFKVDDQPLSNVAALKGIAVETFDPEVARLSLKLLAFNDRRTVAQIRQFKQLLPVFTFSYPPGSAVPTHIFQRTSICGDETCFYTTEEDQAELGTLRFRWQFTGLAAASINIGLIVGLLIAALLLLLIVLLLVVFVVRDPGQTYLVDEKERQQGNHPEQEAKDEQFKEYQRPEEGPLRAKRLSLASDFSAASKDDRELDNYGDDEIDFSKFGEDGSFIGTGRSGMA